MLYFANWNIFIFKESDPGKRSDPVANAAGESTVDKINDITDGVAQEVQDGFSMIASSVI